MTAHDVDTPGAGEPRRPNPEAIAWYVEEAQRLLEDQQRRAESLRTRGGQIAGFGAAVLALIGGNAAGLLGDLHGLVGALIGVALLGAGCFLVSAVAIAVWGSLRPRAFATISANEIERYASSAFLTEPDLWRVHVRSIHMLNDAVASIQSAGDSAARAVEWSLFTFLVGLAFSLLAIATLAVESIS